MAGIDDGSIVGFIRGITARKHASQIEDASRNYLADPGATIAAVNDIHGGGPAAAQALQVRQRDDAAYQQKQQQDQQTRYIGAVRNMAGMLGQARDSGADIGATFDQLTPVMEKGLGMSPADIAEHKAAIMANPALIDAMGRDADAKLMNISAGASVYDPNTKKEVYSNPGLAKPITIKRGDGGTDVMIWDPDSRSFVQQGTAPAGGPGLAGGGGADPAGAAGGAGSGPLTLDTVKPHLIAQESHGDYTALNPESGTLGAYQIKPSTGAALAEKLGIAWVPGLMTSNTAQGRQYQDTIGNAAISEALKASGGNPEKFGRYYHGGSVTATGPRTDKYAAELAARVAGGPQPGQTVPVPSSGAPSAVYSTPGKPTKPGYRVATPEEKAVAGVDPNTPYQVSPDGKIEKIGERPMGAAGRTLGTAKPSQITDYYDTLSSMRKEADRLLNSPDLDRAIGPVQGRVAGYYDKSAAGYQDALKALGSKILISTLSKLKTLSATGASGMGNLSNKEGDTLREQMGTLTPTSSEAEVRRSLNNIIEWSDKQLGAMPNFGKIPPEAVRMLRQKPKTKAQFDEIFGEGMADFYLGGAK